MDPRIGQRIVRDRWGEPIEPRPPSPKRSKSKRRLLPIFSWLWPFLPVRVATALRYLARFVRQALSSTF